MKLLDEFEDKEYKIGDIITDDFGDEWFILGFSNQGWVQVVRNDKLNKVAERYFAGTFSMKVEV